MSPRLSRRDVLRQGLCSAGAAVCPDVPDGAADTTQAKAKSVIQIWLAGGPSHLDSFDPKPDAGNDYCGPLNKPIATNVDGIRIGELLPLLAKQADKYLDHPQHDARRTTATKLRPI